MKLMACIFGVLICSLVTGCAYPVPPHRGADTQPNPSASEIASHLHLRMSTEEAKHIVETIRPGVRPRDGAISTGLDYARYSTGEDEFLVLRFDNIRDPNADYRDQVTDILIQHFDDLKGDVPTELFPFLRLIQHSPSIEGYEFNPLPLIRAVNGLRPLGKEGALQALREYVRLTYSSDLLKRWQYDLDEQRVFLIARLLFVRTDGDPRMPSVYGGATELKIKPVDLNWSLFPLALQDDMPFCLITGYNLGGLPEDPTEHIDYCQANCVLRNSPLTPKHSPLEAAQELFGSASWRILFSNDYLLSETKSLIRSQAIRGIADLIPEASEDKEMTPYRTSENAADQHWARYLAELKSRPLRWDPTDQLFR